MKNIFNFIITWISVVVTLILLCIYLKHDFIERYCIQNLEFGPFNVQAEEINYGLIQG